MPRATKPTLSTIDLAAAHGYRSCGVSGEQWVEPRFGWALARDYQLAEDMVKRASVRTLQVFLRAQGRRLVAERDGLKSQALLCIMAAWWPLKEMPAESAAHHGFTFAASAPLAAAA